MTQQETFCDMTRRTPGVKSYLHPDVRRALNDRNFLNKAKALHNGPVHVIFPHVMQENIERMKAFFERFSFPTTIYYTCKPNKSKVFLKQAFLAGLNVDVSSAEELVTALSVGFRGVDIGCTNLKNVPYLHLAVEHGCLISVDNFSELVALAEIHGKARYKDKCRIMLRISDLRPKDRQMIPKISKFGVAEADLDEMIVFILSQNNIFDFQGFHFHHDNPLPDLHAGYIDHALTIMEDIQSRHNLSSRVLDIGGGLRVPNIQDTKEWSTFVEYILEGVTNNMDTGTWNNKAYGMRLSSKGKAEGRGKLEGRGKSQDYTAFLQEVLDNTSLRGHPLHRVISDNLLSIIVEPGASLLGHAGFTIVRVSGSKKLANCDNAVFVDGNIYNISNQFMEQFADFIHVPQYRIPNPQPYDAYIIDNLCNERGIMSSKCMYFDQQPVNGDLIIIPNTAAYLSDFEDASPHMHPQGRKIVAVPADQDFAIYDEVYYAQFIQGVA